LVWSGLSGRLLEDGRPTVGSPCRAAFRDIQFAVNRTFPTYQVQADTIPELNNPVLIVREAFENSSLLLIEMSVHRFVMKEMPTIRKANPIPRETTIAQPTLGLEVKN